MHNMGAGGMIKIYSYLKRIYPRCSVNFSAVSFTPVNDSFCYDKLCFHESSSKKCFSSKSRQTVSGFRAFNCFITEAPISNRSQSIELPSKSVDWFLYGRDLRHERVKDKIAFCYYSVKTMLQCIKTVRFFMFYQEVQLSKSLKLT